MKIRDFYNANYSLYKTVAVSLITLCIVVTGCDRGGKDPRDIIDFNDEWRFMLSDSKELYSNDLDDSGWRILKLPHDWSIEGDFSPAHPATPGGGALPGGTGWYRKHFNLQGIDPVKKVFIEFDGIYMNSEVWINGQYLGHRPNGYISFRYDLTEYLHYGDTVNVIAVRVDNSRQPNSRWYSGSGIYRDVRLVITDPVHVDHWGTYVTTSEITDQSAIVNIETTIRNSNHAGSLIQLHSVIKNSDGRTIADIITETEVPGDSLTTIKQEISVTNPHFWGTDDPYLYKLVSKIESDDRITDSYVTDFGIRSIRFDSETGFILNGKNMKIKGVCNHHDLGCLGAAVNMRATERQLDILKDMGCNAIRTSHNPPSPVLLDLCDRMGFLVMDETFDMWELAKSPYDYHLYWNEWHRRDLTDHILRDRNHPSVIMWSIGNEILEQWDSTGIKKTVELASIVRQLDPTRPVTAGCNFTHPSNFLIRSGALDLIGFNYHHEQYPNFPEVFPGQKLIASETSSALATRGSYDMPSDSIHRWPVAWDRPFNEGNADHTCSAYDNCSAPWGSTHEETLLMVDKYDFVSGIFVWTGFDYLGEPTPYSWPSRSSYFGIIDLAGFPKDAYYLYKSIWTDEPVLHLFPHWNWEPGDTVDVWTYTSSSEVELFLNDRSLGVKGKPEGSMHMQWRVPFEPGRLTAKGISSQSDTLITVVETAGEPAKIRLSADREVIKADGNDLSFITVYIEDSEGRVVPSAGNPVSFETEGAGELAGVDNGSQTGHESFRGNSIHAFHGLCLAVLRSGKERGVITLSANAEGLESDEITIKTK